MVVGCFAFAAAVLVVRVAAAGFFAAFVVFAADLSLAFAFDDVVFADARFADSLFADSLFADAVLADFFFVDVALAFDVALSLAIVLLFFAAAFFVVAVDFF